MKLIEVVVQRLFSWNGGIFPVGATHCAYDKTGPASGGIAFFSKRPGFNNETATPSQYMWNGAEEGCKCITYLASPIPEDWRTGIVSVEEFNEGVGKYKKELARLLIPDGWKLVPVEPTMEILDEFDSLIDYGAEDSKDAWRKLLAAAPAIPEFTTQAVDADTTSTQFESLSSQGKPRCICIECGAVVPNPEKPHRCVKQEPTK